MRGRPSSRQATRSRSAIDCFLDRRKEALFRDTQFTGLMLPTNLDLTRKAAEEALGVFAQRGRQDDWTLGDLPASLSSEQQAEVGEGCYELLLVLAEAVATQDAGAGRPCPADPRECRPIEARVTHARTT